MSPVVLSASTIKTISKYVNNIPKYKRNVVPSIVHFGVGNFCRAHLFQNTHRVNNQITDSECTPSQPWLIHGIGVLNNDIERDAFEKIKSSNFLYGLLTLPSKNSEIIGSLCSYDWVPYSDSSLHNAINSIAQPETKIISLTITEKGYCMDIDGNLDFSNPDVLHDVKLLVDKNKTSSCFKTSIGLLVEGLNQRKNNKSAGPLTLLSCDNLPSNGNVLKSILVAFVKKTGNIDLLDYVEKSLSFPNLIIIKIMRDDNIIIIY